MRRKRRRVLCPAKPAKKAEPAVHFERPFRHILWKRAQARGPFSPSSGGIAGAATNIAEQGINIRNEVAVANGIFAMLGLG